MPEMMTQPEAPICATQRCKRPLTYLGPPQNCWRCLVCNPIVEAKPTESRKRRDIDRQLSEERVLELIKNATTGGLDEEKIREIIQDELQNWFIQKPPITKDEIVEAVGVGGETFISSVDVTPPKQTWRQDAKVLGISLMKEPKGTGARKKEEVLADIAAARVGGPPEDKNVPVDGGY